MFRSFGSDRAALLRVVRASGRRIAAVVIAVATVGGLLLLGADAALAHGLQIVGRKDVPVPDWLFVWGSAVVLVLSFLLLAMSWRTPIFDGMRWRAAPQWLSRLLLGAPARALAGLVGVALLVLVVYSGLEGTQASAENFAPNFVFVTFWLGLVPLSLLFGNIFSAFSPWAAIGRAFEKGFALLLGRERPPLLEYPDWLGRWPAVVGLVGFVWFELVFGFAREGIAPEEVAVAALGYTGITFAGIVVFGAERWIERGEAFAGFYGMIASLSPVAVRDERLGVQPPLIGAAKWNAMPGSVALVCASIGATIYDGALEPILNDGLRWLSDRMLDVNVEYVLSLRAAGTLLLVGCVAFVAAIYWAGVRGMRTVRGAPSLGRLGSLFAHALIPIAVGYFVSHYFSLFYFVEQAQFTYLISDPLGDGSDLFGLADSSIDYTSLSATFVWYLQVGALVAGHVAGLILAHERALVVFPDYKTATRSQYWMLVVMVAFTLLGMFLLSESNQ